VCLEHHDAAPVDGGQPAGVGQVRRVRENVRLGDAAAGLAVPVVQRDRAHGVPAAAGRAVLAGGGQGERGAAHLAALGRLRGQLGRGRLAQTLVAAARVRQLAVGRQPGPPLPAPLPPAAQPRPGLRPRQRWPFLRVSKVLLVFVYMVSSSFKISPMMTMIA
jgi:hypothetical protein